MVATAAAAQGHFLGSRLTVFVGEEPVGRHFGRDPRQHVRTTLPSAGAAEEGAARHLHPHGTSVQGAALWGREVTVSPSCFRTSFQALLSTLNEQPGGLSNMGKTKGKRPRGLLFSSPLGKALFS